MDAESLSGKLLVALPSLRDPNFSRSVVLVLEHGTEGALGVVLNRPTEVGLERELPGWVELAGEHQVFFVGGPVGSNTAIALGRVDATDAAELGEGWRAVLEGVGTVDLVRDPGDLRPEVRMVRVFAGYAGWSAGQLDGEVAEGSWLVVDAVAEDAFSEHPERLWRAVLARQPGRVRWLANYPQDVSLN